MLGFDFGDFRIWGNKIGFGGIDEGEYDETWDR